VAFAFWGVNRELMTQGNLKSCLRHRHNFNFTINDCGNYHGAAVAGKTPAKRTISGTAGGILRQTEKATQNSPT
jgi:hypothetical protein